MACRPAAPRLRVPMPANSPGSGSGWPPASPAAGGASRSADALQLCCNSATSLPVECSKRCHCCVQSWQPSCGSRVGSAGRLRALSRFLAHLPEAQLLWLSDQSILGAAIPQQPPKQLAAYLAAHLIVKYEDGQPTLCRHSNRPLRAARNTVHAQAALLSPAAAESGRDACQSRREILLQSKPKRASWLAPSAGSAPSAQAGCNATQGCGWFHATCPPAYAAYSVHSMRMSHLEPVAAHVVLLLLRHGLLMWVHTQRVGRERTTTSARGNNADMPHPYVTTVHSSAPSEESNEPTSLMQVSRQRMPTHPPPESQHPAAHRQTGCEGRPLGAAAVSAQRWWDCQVGGRQTAGSCAFPPGAESSVWGRSKNASTGS